MSLTGFTGVYCPYTGESCVNMDSPAAMTIDESIKEGARVINPEFYEDNFSCHKVGPRGEGEEGFETVS